MLKRVMRLMMAGAVVLTMAAQATVQAAPAPKDSAKQTPWGLYLTSKEAYDMKTVEGGKVLFVDVRDPIEIMFTGFTDVVDLNVPYLLSDRSKWNEKKSVFLMKKNPDFAAAVARALENRGLSKATPVILMCRSGGERGAPSAKALDGQGFEKVYIVVDGFEGGTLKDGTHKNWRLKDGWKNSGLPWSYKLNKEKMYGLQ